MLAGHILNDRIMIFNLLNQGATDLMQLNQNSHGRRFFKKEGCCVLKYRIRVSNLEHTIGIF